MATKTTVKPKMKSYVSTFVLRLGPISTTGRLVSVTLPKDTKNSFKLATPDGLPVEQRYIDPNGKLYEPSQLVRSVTNDEGEVITVDQAGIEAAKESLLPPNVLTATVHDACTVDQQLFPSDHNAYVLEPDTTDPANTKWHDFIVGVLSNDKCEKTLIGMCNLRNSEALFRVSVWRGHLVIQRQKFPSEIHDHDLIEKHDVSKAEIQKGLAMLDKLAQPFDAEAYRNTIAERQQALIEASKKGDVKATEAITAPVKVKKAKDKVDVLSALEAMGF